MSKNHRIALLWFRCFTGLSAGCHYDWKETGASPSRRWLKSAFSRRDARDLRDKETGGHRLRVTEMRLRLASAMGMNEAELVHIRRGALLHDIGKMGVPDSILLKPGPLSAVEWTIMRKHPQYAYDLLSPIAYLRLALDTPYCHHQKWDGTGYPHGLKAAQIPFAARIFAVVDVWDALRSDRPYRKGWPDEKVRAHIQSLSGTHFDSQAVEAFLQLISEGDPLKL